MAPKVSVQTNSYGHIALNIIRSLHRMAAKGNDSEAKAIYEQLRVRLKNKVEKYAQLLAQPGETEAETKAIAKGDR